MADDDKWSSASTLQPLGQPIASRWWEEAAEEVLRTSHTFNDIQLICKYLPFQEANIPCSILAGRQTDWLYAFLSTLQGHKYDKVQYRDDNSHEAREIVSLSRWPDSSLPPAWDGEWVLPAISCQMDATIIAEKFDFNICKTFGKITFYSWVRFSLGYEDAVVSRFLDGMSNSRNDLARYFREFDPPKGKWEAVAEASLYYFQKSNKSLTLLVGIARSTPSSALALQRSRLARLCSFFRNLSNPTAILNTAPRLYANSQAACNSGCTIQKQNCARYRG